MHQRYPTEGAVFRMCGDECRDNAAELERLRRENAALRKRVDDLLRRHDRRVTAAIRGAAEGRPQKG